MLSIPDFYQSFFFLITAIFPLSNASIRKNYDERWDAAALFFY